MTSSIIYVLRAIGHSLILFFHQVETALRWLDRRFGRFDFVLMVVVSLLLLLFGRCCALSHCVTCHLSGTRLLYTDRRTWIPKGSIPAEENHRVIIIDELFQALVRTEPDQAYIMFIILTNDQNGKTLPLGKRIFLYCCL